MLALMFWLLCLICMAVIGFKAGYEWDKHYAMVVMVLLGAVGGGYALGVLVKAVKLCLK